jgi:hypothetical protein
MQLMRSLLGVLQPFENSGASHGNVLYAWQMAHLAITNGGNNLVIFGQTTSSWVSEPKFYLFALCTLLMSIGSVACLALRRRAPAWVLIGFLPLSFLLVASLFGHRLWAHHFSVLVPFVYLLPLPLLARILDMTKAGQRPQMAIVAVACFACLAGNMSQQYAFHAALGRSGGEGKATSALNQLALEARGSSSNVAYVFPEWGFFTSFCLLTENKVRYVVDVAPETLSELRHAGYDDLRLVYWQPAERERYMQVLQQAGLNTITTRTFTTLDGRPVFYWLEGHPASP